MDMAWSAMHHRIGSCRASCFSLRVKVVKDMSAEQENDGTGSGNDEFHRVLTDNRHLMSMISAVRTELEESHAGKAAAVQSAVAECRDEIRQLQTTIQMLRDEMQAIATEKADSVQKAVANGRDENRQLEKTISALRDELEEKAFLHADELDRQSRAHGDELRQLRDTISSLRTILEKNNAG